VTQEIERKSFQPASSIVETEALRKVLQLLRGSADRNYRYLFVWRAGSAEEATEHDHPGRLLVVDDAEMNRELPARRLERKGFKMEMAESGDRALETFKRKKVQNEFKVAKEAAEAATRTKSGILACMGHGIRTPLDKPAEMLKLRSKTTLDNRQGGYVTAATVCTDGILRVMDDVRGFARSPGGGITLEESDFVLGGVLSAAVQAHADEAREKGLELTCSIAEDVPRSLHGDPRRLRQIVRILLVNAVEFNSSGAVAVRASCVLGRCDRLKLRFTVGDTGVGIAQEQSRNLLEAFNDAGESSPGPPRAAAAMKASDQPIDHEALLAEWDGDAEFVARMFEMFLRQTTCDVTDLRAACEGGDTAAVARLAHRIKGSAGELGAQALRPRAANLEAIGRASDLSQASTCMHALQADFDRLCSQIMKAIDRVNAGELWLNRQRTATLVSELRQIKPSPLLAPAPEPVDQLTGREREVITLIGEGLEN
jgi:signal transduction histidine kinase/HPt (histidine-containing phosphotransfer) domain-containing protein